MSKENYKNIAELIEHQYKECNINQLEIVSHIDNALATFCFVGGYRAVYDVSDGKLIIQETICFNNVLEYYNFMSDEDKIKYQSNYDIRVADEKRNGSEMRDLVRTLNKENKRLTRTMDELGFTSQGHRAEYFTKGRTIYKGTYGNNRYRNPIKVAVFVKKNAESLKEQLIKEEVTDVIAYFAEAKELKGCVA
jgi:hypothetical protein